MDKFEKNIRMKLYFSLQKIIIVLFKWVKSAQFDDKTKILAIFKGHLPN